MIVMCFSMQWEDIFELVDGKCHVLTFQYERGKIILSIVMASGISIHFSQFVDKTLHLIIWDFLSIFKHYIYKKIGKITTKSGTGMWNPNLLTFKSVHYIDTCTNEGHNSNDGFSRTTKTWDKIGGERRYSYYKK